MTVNQYKYLDIFVKQMTTLLVAVDIMVNGKLGNGKLGNGKLGNGKLGNRKI